MLLLVLSLARPSAPASVPAAVRVVARGVSPEATAENSQRKLLVDPRGRIFLAFVQPVGGIDQIVVAESGDRGRTWRMQQQVTHEAQHARLPSLDRFPDGSLHLVWTEYAPIGRIYHAVRRGGRWTDEAALSVRGIYAGIPVVTPRAGWPHVLWYGIVPERPSVRTRHGAIYEIVFTRQERTGWTRPVSISPGIPDSLNPALAADSAGVLHAAWYQFDGRVYQIRYRRYDGRWSPVRTLTGGRTENTAVALATSGREVHLVWVEQGAVRRVMYRALAGSAAPIATGAEVRGPVIAAAGGRVVAAWAQEGRILLRPLRPAGPARVVGRGSGPPALALFGDAAMVAWTATTGGASDIRFAVTPVR